MTVVEVGAEREFLSFEFTTTATSVTTTVVGTRGTGRVHGVLWMTSRLCTLEVW